MDPVDLLGHATEFQFKLYPEGHEYWDIAHLAVTVAWRGPGDRWAVLERSRRQVGCAGAELVL